MNWPFISKDSNSSITHYEKMFWKSGERIQRNDYFSQEEYPKESSVNLADSEFGDVNPLDENLTRVRVLSPLTPSKLVPKSVNAHVAIGPTNAALDAIEDHPT